MRTLSIVFRGVLALVLVGLIGAAFHVVVAQTSSSSTNSETSAVQGGVVISPEGVLSRQFANDPGDVLFRQRLEAAKASLSADVKAYSNLRKVSLNRLEKFLAQQQNVPTEEMKYLAGLQRVRYVFYYPETKDIVLAGPAEGWATNQMGRVIGLTTRRPALQLQDLAVAMRAFPAGKEGDQRAITCSIDPTKEGLAAMQQFLRQTGGNATPGQTQYIVTNLRKSLGMQTITIGGVSPNTNFARVLVEADYRMKLIGIGLEQPPVRLASFVQLANPSQVSKNALFRWYFVPDYQCLRVTDDQFGVELVGDGVKLVGEDELVSAAGQRSAAGSSRASQEFAHGFSKRYPELAERSPVYAELRNVIDLSIAAAFMQKQDYYGKAGWKAPILTDEKAYSVERLPAPKQVESAVAAVWKGNRLTTPIGGGVRIEASMALEKDNRLPDENGKVSKTRDSVKVDVPANRWWWD